MLHMRVYENKRRALEGFKDWCGFHKSNILQSKVTTLEVILFDGSKVSFRYAGNGSSAVDQFQGYVIGTCEFIGNIQQDVVDYINLRIRH